MDYHWKIKDVRNHINIINGENNPDIVFQNARYLHSMLKQWVKGNIWVSGDRIVYTGQEMPKNVVGTEIIDVENKVIVPGYIEPHVHPTQLYNPQSFADYAAQGGTTTFISDNLTLLLMLKEKKAFSLIEKLNTLPFIFYWWARFDAQTEIYNEEEIFTTSSVQQWLDRSDVLLGGELTGWPRLLQGDNQMLHWILQAKHINKKIEGHFPGASSNTLAKMKLIGADGDHEAMTFEDVEKRILHGYVVTLRHSSIRQDLESILKDVIDKQLAIFDHLMMTTDGSTPSFYRKGVMDQCIQLALDAGVSPIDAYQMASYNIARYYDLTHYQGIIATGRVATFNILKDEFTPTPESVLSKGVWLKRDGIKSYTFDAVDWQEEKNFEVSFDVEEKDFQFSTPLGIKLENDVITKPYNVTAQVVDGQIIGDLDECFLMLVDRNGKWRVNTFIKGFATNIDGLISSYSNTGDFIFIGKNLHSMKKAFVEFKKMKGGIVLVDKDEVIASIPLAINGLLSESNFEELMDQELVLKQALMDRGYHLGDAIYSLLFLQSTHLPYIRITPKGIFDVMKNKLLLPAVMR
ncbi:adenine deaminase C-terminal domain-containing protein [Lysinibacillus sp. UGB7]|uniref:adenine deaminase C-terminal domain-containing protein n=1 Tax=Lysinibacillus sp. UGB7 TaxID=3411039 RepID=UPI003B79CB5F